MTKRTMVRNAWALLLFLLLILSLIGRARAQDAAPADVPEYPSFVAFDTGLARLLEGIPLAEELRGTAHVWMGTRGVEGGADTRLNLRSDVQLAGLSLGALEIEVLTPYGAERSHLSVRLQGDSLQLEGEFDVAVEIDVFAQELVWPVGRIDGTLNLKVTDSKVLAGFGSKWPLAGPIQLDLQVSGRSDAPTVAVSALGSHLTWFEEELGDVRLSWNHAEGISRLELLWGNSDKPLLTASASLPVNLSLHGPELQWRDTEALHLSVEVAAVDAKTLRPFWRAPSGVALSLDGQLELDGSLDAYTLSGILRGNHTSSSGESTPFELTLQGSEVAQTLTASVPEGLAELSVTTQLALSALRRIGARLEPTPLSGQVSLALPLAWLAPYLWSGLDTPIGILEGDLMLGGTLGSPTLDGALKLADTELTLVALARRLKKLEVSAVFAGDTMALETISAVSAPGTLKGSGGFKFLATSAPDSGESGLWGAWRLDGRLSLELEEFPFVQDGFPLGTTKGAVTLEVGMGPSETVAVVSLSDFVVALTDESLPKALIIPTNPAIRVVDSRGEGNGVESLLIGAGHLNLTVDLVDPIHIVGPEVDVEFEGHLVVDRQGDLIRVDGGFEPLEGGYFELFENHFAIQIGRISLSEGYAGKQVGGSAQEAARLRDANAAPEATPLEPVVELIAQGLVVDTTVQVGIDGPARRPALTLASAPALPEYQIMTLLVSGRVDAVDDHNGNVRRQVAKLVERYHNPGLKRQLFDRLGIDNIGLGFALSIGNPIVTVGKQLSRQLYLETVYRHSARPNANMMEGHVEYRLSSHLTVDSFFGEAAEGAIGLFWATSFGGPPPPTPDKDWGLSNLSAHRADDDADGLENLFDRCRYLAEDPDGFEDQDGCPEDDNDRDGILDAMDAEPNTPEEFNGFDDNDGGPDVAPTTLTNFVAHVQNLGFEANKSSLRAEDAPALAGVVALLERFPTVQVEITGHSDDKGSVQRNQKVSERRARAAWDFLTHAGVAKERLLTFGAGSTVLLDKEQSDEARARNRRVEFHLFVQEDELEAPGSP